MNGPRRLRSATVRLRRAWLVAVAVALVAGVSSGCAPAGAASQTTLTVLAASSLTEVFPAIGAAFTAENPRVRVAFSFAGSPDLAAQVDAGAPADVIAVAGTSSLTPISGALGPSTTFTTNALTIIVPPGNPAGVQSLSDLATTDVSLAAPEVPAGEYARQSLHAAGVTVRPVSEEPDVKSVVSRVTLGGADAGIVYTTDARAAGDSVQLVPIPARFNVVATYPAATLLESASPGDAASFVEFLTSATAQQLLREAGFGPAPGSS